MLRSPATQAAAGRSLASAPFTGVTGMAHP